MTFFETLTEALGETLGETAKLQKIMYVATVIETVITLRRALRSSYLTKHEKEAMRAILEVLDSYLEKITAKKR